MKRAEKKAGSGGAKAVLFCLAITVVTGLGIAGFWLYQQVTIVEPATKTANAAAEQTANYIAELEAKKHEPVYITLPGAKQIQAPVENYEDPTNLWTLVNKERALPMDYVPPQLVIPALSIRANSTNDEKHVRSVIVDPLTQMFSDADKAGHSLMISVVHIDRLRRKKGCLTRMSPAQATRRQICIVRTLVTASTKPG